MINKIYARQKEKCAYCGKELNVGDDCVLLNEYKGISTIYHPGCFAELAMKLSLGEQVSGVTFDPPELKNALIEYDKIKEKYEKAKQDVEKHCGVYIYSNGNTITVPNYLADKARDLINTTMDNAIHNHLCSNKNHIAGK